MCLIYFLFRGEFEVVLVWIVKKSVFLVQILWILKLQFKDWPLKWIFIKEFTFISKNDMYQIVKKNLFCSNNTLETHIFNSWPCQKLLLVANHLQDSTFEFDINSEASSLVSVN